MKRPAGHSTAPIVAILLMSPLPLSLAQAPVGDISDEVVRKVDPSVVAVQHERSGGSGFVLSAEGYVLTNGHVVRGNDSEDPTKPAKAITVIMHDERKFPAEVVGFCMDPDVALIRIQPDQPLQPVEFADSRKAQIGQKCFAVGTPIGLKRTFTSGILSNVDRTDLGTFTKVFQTDAAINPGNSGGPLFDRAGRVLGINTYASRGQNSLGFTVPAHVVLVVKDHLLRHGRFTRTDFPVFFAGELYEELATTLGVDEGALIHYVMEDTPAERAGLRAGDILTSFNGRPCSARTRGEMMEIDWQFSTQEPGKPVSLTVLRGRQGERRQITVTGTLEPSEPFPVLGRNPGELVTHRYGALGLGFKRLVRMHRLIHGLGDQPGVFINEIRRDTPAARAGLAPRDIITHVAGRQVSDVDSFRRLLEEQVLQCREAIEMTVERRKTTVRTALAPNYDLAGRKVAVIVPGISEYKELVTRELIADGASITLLGLDSTPEFPGLEKRGTVTEDTRATDYDAVLFTEGSKAEALWTDADVLRLVSEAHADGRVLAAIGASSLVLVAGETALLEKKITTAKEYSGEALKRGVHYTGNDVEKDGKVVTTTGFERSTVRSFVKALRALIMDSPVSDGV